MSRGQDIPGADLAASLPTAAGFDEGFTAMAASLGIRRVWELVDPDLPAEVEPFCLVSVALLGHLAGALALAPGAAPGGPGMRARRAGTVAGAVAGRLPDRGGLLDRRHPAGQRPGGVGRAGRGGTLVVGDLAATGLADAIADAVISIDALHFAADLPAAGREVLRLLRPGRHLVLSGWQPRPPDDARLPSRLRIDWAAALRLVGFVEVQVESRSGWHDLFTGVYRVALDLGAAGEDAALAALQDEARHLLSTAELADRVVVSAARPDGGGAAGPAG